MNNVPYTTRFPFSIESWTSCRYFCKKKGGDLPEITTRDDIYDLVRNDRPYTVNIRMNTVSIYVSLYIVFRSI